MSTLLVAVPLVIKGTGLRQHDTFFDHQSEQQGIGRYNGQHYLVLSRRGYMLETLI
jgi:hypothetical protein